MRRFLAPFTEQAYALLRIVAGLMFMYHGVRKIVYGEVGDGSHHAQVVLGGWIEMVCGGAIALGVFTSWAAFLASGTMAVAYVQFHWQLRFDEMFFPGANQGELALLYSFLFLYVACRGSGMWSVQRSA